MSDGARREERASREQKRENLMHVIDGTGGEYYNKERTKRMETYMNITRVTG